MSVIVTYSYNKIKVGEKLVVTDMIKMSDNSYRPILVNQVGKYVSTGDSFYRWGARDEEKKEPPKINDKYKGRKVVVLS
jgi:predicted restriction endonuclease